jgi:hypothetical protein
MQVLSQLSYNPTIGPLIGAISDANPAGFTAARRASSAADRSPASTNPGSLGSAGNAYCSRVNAFV